VRHSAALHLAAPVRRNQGFLSPLVSTLSPSILGCLRQPLYFTTSHTVTRPTPHQSSADRLTHSKHHLFPLNTLHLLALATNCRSFPPQLCHPSDLNDLNPQPLLSPTLRSSKLACRTTQSTTERALSGLVTSPVCISFWRSCRTRLARTSEPSYPPRATLCT
jgi:hypothetical protein